MGSAIEAIDIDVPIFLSSLCRRGVQIAELIQLCEPQD